MTSKLKPILGSKGPSQSNELGMEIRFVSLSDGQNHWNDELLTDDIQSNIWDAMMKYGIRPASGQLPDHTWPRQSYPVFRDIGGYVQQSSTFTPSLFSRFPQDTHGRIQARALHRYFREKSRIHGNAVSILQLIGRGTSVLNDDDVNLWLHTSLKRAPQLHESIEQHDFEDFYIFMAQRLVLVQLGTFDCKSGLSRISLFDLASSRLYSDFQAVQNGSKAAKNWFAVQSMSNLYNYYVDLDKDCDGLQSLSELSPIYDYAVPQPVLETFMSLGTRYTTTDQNGGVVHPVDFRLFIDLVLCMEFPSLEFSIRLLFKVLCQTVGARDQLFKHHVDELVQIMHTHVMYTYGEIPEGFSSKLLAEDVFHLCDCYHKDYLVVSDLLASEQGHIALNILTSWHFWFVFETREGSDILTPPPNFLFNMLNRE